MNRFRNKLCVNCIIEYERSIRGSREEQSTSSSTDPRQVIAALAELSGNDNINIKLNLMSLDFQERGPEDHQTRVTLRG